MLRDLDRAIACGSLSTYTHTRFTLISTASWGNNSHRVCDSGCSGTTLHSKNSVFASMTRSTDNCRASYESLLVPDTVVSGTVIAKIYFKKWRVILLALPTLLCGESSGREIRVQTPHKSVEPAGLLFTFISLRLFYKDFFNVES